MVGFKGLTDGAYHYKAIAPTRGFQGWRVRTFDQPSSVATFIASFVGRGLVRAVFEDGTVDIVNADGKVVVSNLRHILSLLSDDEARLLALFGINLPAMAAGKEQP